MRVAGLEERSTGYGLAFKELLTTLIWFTV